MNINLDTLKEWSACGEGLAWFTEHYPQGGEYTAVNMALRKAKLYDWSGWLANAVYGSFLKNPELIAQVVKSEVDQAIEETKDYPAASSGDYSTSASSGYGSTAASSGDVSTAASSGNASTAASSGDSSTAASSGDSSKAAATGKQTIAMVAGLNGSAKAGDQGAFALAWLDGEQIRIAVGVVGEDGIKADTWYRVNQLGALEEVEA